MRRKQEGLDKIRKLEAEIESLECEEAQLKAAGKLIDSIRSELARLERSAKLPNGETRELDLVKDSLALEIPERTRK